jgi:hypothetical protein
MVGVACATAIEACASRAMIVLFDGFAPLDAIAPYEVLWAGAMATKGSLQVELASLEGVREVRSGEATRDAPDRRARRQARRDGDTERRDRLAGRRSTTTPSPCWPTIARVASRPWSPPRRRAVTSRGSDAWPVGGGASSTGRRDSLRLQWRGGFRRAPDLGGAGASEAWTGGRGARGERPRLTDRLQPTSKPPARLARLYLSAGRIADARASIVRALSLACGPRRQRLEALAKEIAAAESKAAAPTGRPRPEPRSR